MTNHHCLFRAITHTAQLARRDSKLRHLRISLRQIGISHLVTTERFHTAHSDYLSASNPCFWAQLELTAPVLAFFGTFQIYTTQPRIRDRDNQAEQIEKETDEIGYRLITETTTNCSEP